MACRIVTIFPLLGWCLLVFNVLYSSGRTAREWKTRVVYQIVTDRFAHTSEPLTPSPQCTFTDEYCYGTFKGIEKYLDYITNLGVNAILISPFTLNTDNGYHGYWPQDIYTVNPIFGTSKELVELVNECHKRDVWVMADLVIHHMGYLDGCTQDYCSRPSSESNFSQFIPFNKLEHYVDFYYWKDNLPKLDHSNSFVRTTLVNWVKQLVSDYKFDGFRISDIDDIPMDFLSELNDAIDIFIIGLASTSITEAKLASYQSVLDAVFDNNMYYALDNFFHASEDNKGYYLIPDRLSLGRGLFKDASLVGGYIDNDIVGRFLSEDDDFTELRDALAYLLMADWIPFIYYGTEQGRDFKSSTTSYESLWPYYVEERSLYKFISKILKHRRNLFGTSVSDYQGVEHVECTYYKGVYSFARKSTFVIISDGGYTPQSSRYLIRRHPFEKETVLTNIFDPTDSVTVQDNGTFYVTLENNEPKIYSGGSKRSQGLIFIPAIGAIFYHLFTGW